MSLTYLSGDYIAGKKSKSGGKPKKSKQEKKAGRKRVKKKVAKVALAPARAAFLTVLRLNALKLSTKLVRVFKMPNGPAIIQKFWTGFGGDYAKLKQAISKGAKQSINADDIGSATATAIATATPIIVALIPIIKQFKAGGDKKEAKEFDQGVNEGKKDLANDSDVPKSDVSMPQNKEVGIIADKNGDNSEDKRVPDNQPESKSGGTDTENEGGRMSKKEAEKAMSSNFSPLGFFSMILLYSLLIHTNNAIVQTVIKILSTYSFIAMCLIPLATKSGKFQRVAYMLSFAPFNFITNQFYTIKWLRK